jgi:hypothetical protein
MQSSIYAFHLSRMIRLSSIIHHRHSHTLSFLMLPQSPTRFQPLFHIANQHLSNVSQPCVRRLPAECLSFQRPASTIRIAQPDRQAYPPSHGSHLHLNLVLAPHTQNSTKVFKRNISPSPYPSQTIPLIYSLADLPFRPSLNHLHLISIREVISEKHDKFDKYEMWLVFYAHCFSLSRFSRSNPGYRMSRLRAAYHRYVRACEYNSLTRANVSSQRNSKSHDSTAHTHSISIGNAQNITNWRDSGSHVHAECKCTILYPLHENKPLQEI